MNAELAELYELPNVRGDDMRQVNLSDSRRGATWDGSHFDRFGHSNRTSPVLRGKWVLENLPRATLSRKPADAGQLDDKAGDRGMTLREELARHRREASCASCHDKIDPMDLGSRILMPSVDIEKPKPASLSMPAEYFREAHDLKDRLNCVG